MDSSLKRKSFFDDSSEEEGDSDSVTRRKKMVKKSKEIGIEALKSSETEEIPLPSNNSNFSPNDLESNIRPNSDEDSNFSELAVQKVSGKLDVDTLNAYEVTNFPFFYSVSIDECFNLCKDDHLRFMVMILRRFAVEDILPNFYFLIPKKILNLKTIKKIHDCDKHPNIIQILYETISILEFQKRRIESPKVLFGHFGKNTRKCFKKTRKVI